MLSPANSVVAGTNPLTLPLVNANTPIFTYLGKFGGVPSSFISGGSAYSVSGRTMYLSGNQQSSGPGLPNIGAIQIPTPAQIQAGGAMANSTPLVELHTLAGEFGQTAGNTFTVGTGILQYGGNLYVNVGLSYDSTANHQIANIIKCSLDLNTVGSPVAYSPDFSTYIANFNQFLGVVPEVWQSILGGPAFVAGMPGLSIISSQCIGFGFSTFDPADVSLLAGGTVPLKVWMNYPHDGAQRKFNGTGLWSRPNITGSVNAATKVLTVSAINVTGTVINIGATIQAAGYPDNDAANAVTILSRNGDGTYNLSNSPLAVTNTGVPNIWVSNTSANQVTGVSTGGQDLVSTYDGTAGIALIPTGTRSLLFINVHAYAPLYASPSNLACGPGASGNNDPRRVQVTAYDLAAIVANKQAGGNPWAVAPYAWWEFPGWRSVFAACAGLADRGCRAGWLGYDPGAQVMYGTPDGLGSPTGPIHAWSVAAN